MIFASKRHINEESRSLGRYDAGWGVTELSDTTNQTYLTDAIEALRRAGEAAPDLHAELGRIVADLEAIRPRLTPSPEAATKVDGWTEEAG